MKSTVHRVVFPEGESNDRYSIAYFSHPLNDMEIEPVPSQVVQERAVSGVQDDKKRITAEEYLQKRLRETYGWGKSKDVVASD